MALTRVCAYNFTHIFTTEFYKAETNICGSPVWTMSLFWRLGYWGGVYICGKFVCPCYRSRLCVKKRILQTANEMRLNEVI